MEFDPVRFGNLVRARRRHRSLRDIAELSGVSPSTVMRIEHGKMPDVGTFVRLCHALHISMSEVLGLPEQTQVARIGRQWQREDEAK